ncbi:MAG: ABC transporter permease [Candidatus Eisenbacteria bacterium]|nr:ABC transporter permease [Candidatus Eisenbacteria bacterium]
MMRAVFAVARTDWTITLRDRQALLWMFLMPVLFIFVFGNAFRGGGRGGKQPLPVLNEDDRFLGRVVAAELADSTWAPYAVARENSAFAALSNWIEIPAGFTDSVLSGERSTIRVARRGGGSPLRERGHLMNSTLAALRILSHLYEIPDSTLRSAPDTALAALYDSLAARPPLVTLRSRPASGIHERPRGFLLSVPGNLIMFVLIVALTGGAAQIAVESAGGHLRRLGASPLSRFEVFLGKLLGKTLIAVTQIALLVIVSTFLFGMEWGRDPLGLALLLLLYAVVAASIGCFLGLYIRRPETAASIGVLVTLVMASLGGCWWPLEIVPDTMKAVGHIFPTAWAMDGLMKLVAYDGTTLTILPMLGMLAVYALLFAFLASRLLKFD